MLVFTIHWWPAPICVGELLVAARCAPQQIHIGLKFIMAQSKLKKEATFHCSFFVAQVPLISVKDVFLRRWKLDAIIM